MHPGRHACLLLALALAGCDKPEKQAPDTAAPTTKREVRPQRTTPPDIGKRLRSALAEADGIDSPEEREKALAAVAWDALEHDPALSRETLEKLTPGGPERVRLLQHLALRMAEENADEALRWADSFSSEVEKSAACGQIALALSESDPHRAANLLSESGIEGRAFDVVAVQVIRRWAAQSPADAAKWVELFPPGESRATGIQMLVSEWIATDEPAVTAWRSTVRDESIRSEIDSAIHDAQKKSRLPEQ